MDDATLRARLWDGFAALQTLLGGSSRHGRVLYKDGLVASIVPSAPDSPALNAAVALDPYKAPPALRELRETYAKAGVRRWAVWVDGGARGVPGERRGAGLIVASASPGRGAEPRALQIALQPATPEPPGALRPVGRVNARANGNVDARLERTLTTLKE